MVTGVRICDYDENETYVNLSFDDRKTHVVLIMTTKCTGRANDMEGDSFSNKKVFFSKRYVAKKIPSPSKIYIIINQRLI